LYGVAVVDVFAPDALELNIGSVGYEKKGVCGKIARTRRIDDTFDGVAGVPK
jgi:hypothetical protein